MPVRQRFVNVVGGTGGSKNDSIPVYADDKAPRGDQIIINGKQLMLPNGFELVCVDRSALLDGVEDESIRSFFSKDDKYCRVWLLDRDTMTGVEIVSGKNAWVECSHLEDLEIDEDEDEGEDDAPAQVTYEDIGRAVVMFLNLVKTIFSK